MIDQHSITDGLLYVGDCQHRAGHLWSSASTTSQLYCQVLAVANTWQITC